MLKTIWGFILRLFGLEKKGVNEAEMKQNTHFAEQYEDISKVNFTSIFAGHFKYICTIIHHLNILTGS